MKAWMIEQHGELDALKQTDLPRPEPEPGFALIQTRAVGLNHLDLWVRRGVPGHHFPLPLIPGSDISGTIDSFGGLSLSRIESLRKLGLKVGGSVLVNPLLSCGRCSRCLTGFQPTCPEFGLLGETTHGGCADFVSVPVENLLPLPKEISFSEAASLPTAYVTAWSMLTRKTQVSAGDLVLIQAGGSGVSIAAIQIAKLFGAIVITTVGTKEKEAKARALGADYVILYREQNFRNELKAILTTLRRKGVDIALDHIGAETLADSLRALDWGGSLVTCGATSGSKIEIDLKPIFFKNLSIYGSTMGSSADLQKILNLVCQGKLKTQIDSVFKMHELPAAHSRLESRAGFGKVVVTA